MLLVKNYKASQGLLLSLLSSMTPFANCFLVKEEFSRDQKAVMLEKDEFSVCVKYFPHGWFQCLDQWRRKIDKRGGGGAIFIYSCSQSLKTIDFKRS